MLRIITFLIYLSIYFSAGAVVALTLYPIAEVNVFLYWLACAFGGGGLTFLILFLFPRK